MKKYRVYISQINQQYYDVKASNTDAARNKALKAWKAENGPSICAIEEEATP